MTAAFAASEPLPPKYVEYTNAPVASNFVTNVLALPASVVCSAEVMGKFVEPVVPVRAEELEHRAGEDDRHEAVELDRARRIDPLERILEHRSSSQPR